MEKGKRKVVEDDDLDESAEDGNQGSHTSMVDPTDDIHTMAEELESEKVMPTIKWPSLLITYEGGYESEQRDTDDEDPFTSDEDEESNVKQEMVKNKER
ncbi:hypothetical protein V2J09_009411 [Rumex salicifolius]